MLLHLKYHTFANNNISDVQIDEIHVHVRIKQTFQNRYISVCISGTYFFFKTTEIFGNVIIF